LKPKILVFADLDGTLLDDKYEFTHVKPIIRKLLSLHAAIILSSSKTKSEIEFYRRRLGISEPFIVENGSAIVIPRNYFLSKYRFTRQNQHYKIIELGVPYAIVRHKLDLVKKKSGSTIIGFGDLTVEEIANDTGLSTELAKLAKRRQYDEPFKIINGSEEDVIRAIESEGLCYTKGGGYFHLLGGTNKGKALSILKKLYLKEFRRIVTIAVGDSLNDLPMLEVVNKPFMIEDKKSSLVIWQKIVGIAEAHVSQTQ
jgi:mannosyl-3-phosphoglycerate phosphatase